jgi:hypothetical protein
VAAGARRRLLAAGGLAALLLAACAEGGSPELTWAPPALEDPETIVLGSGPTSTNLDPTRDYIIELPDEVKMGATALIGGRNVVLIGGHVRVPADASGDINQRAIYVKDATGTVHIEGVLIDAEGDIEFDGIAINAPHAVVQVQNVRIEGVNGSFEGFHGDVIQPWGGVRQLRIDRLTATSDYQGLQIEQGGPIGGADIRRVNLAHDAGNEGETTFLVWLTLGTSCDEPYPVELADVYVEARENGHASEVVWPPARERLTCAAVPDGAEVTWPDLPVEGGVRDGHPPRGDFVEAGVAGTQYSSPGYR